MQRQAPRYPARPPARLTALRLAALAAGLLLAGCQALLPPEIPGFTPTSPATATLPAEPTLPPASATPSPSPTTPPTSDPDVTRAPATVVAVSTTQPTETPTPDPASPTPAGLPPGPTVPAWMYTPTPVPADALHRIFTPGQRSRVISPFLMEAVVMRGADGLIHLELTGEDGRVIYRKEIDQSKHPNDRIIVGAFVPFELPGTAELGRLTLTSYDRYSRVQYLDSIDLLLLQVGDNHDLGAPQDAYEPFSVRCPYPGTFVQGGVLEVEGLARPVNTSPLIVELIDQNGKVLGDAEADLGLPGGPHQPFRVLVPYEVSGITEALLVLRQESDTRLPGTVYLTSRPVTLGP